MSQGSEPFWGWPGCRLLGLALLLGVGQTLWFAVIYGGADFLTAQHTCRLRLHMDWELHLPLVPPFVLVYMSIYLLFWAAPFILRSSRQLWALSAAMAGVTLVAGVCFLMFPADSAFPPPGDMGAWTGLVRFAKRVALAHNFLPSLHVALSVVCVGVYASRAPWFGRVFLWSWALLIGVATMLLHQHYLVDVVAGLGLGLAGARWIYMPLAERRRASASVAAVESDAPARAS